jgi:hypothetical protein
LKAEAYFSVIALKARTQLPSHWKTGSYYAV